MRPLASRPPAHRSILSYLARSARGAALLAAGLLTSAPIAQAAPALERHRIDPARLSVSGLSSGGYMAVQLGVAFSSRFSGVGVLAGGPYGCADAGSDALVNARRALGPCTQGQYGLVQGCTFGAVCPGPDRPDAASSAHLARERAAQGRIDPLAALARQRVFLLGGDDDDKVVPAVMDALERFYAALVPAAQVRRVRRPHLAHTFPTLDFRGGNPCDVSASPYVSDCNFDGARAVLDAVDAAPSAGTTPTPAANARAVAFDQRPYFPHGTDPVLADEGYVYVPPACATHDTAPCGVHVALHGCWQAVVEVGRAFVDGAGYNRWAEAHRLIVLYPQARRTDGIFSDNPEGCWDWWGYTGTGFDDRRSVQMRAIVAMTEALGAPKPTAGDGP